MERKGYNASTKETARVKPITWISSIFKSRPLYFFNFNPTFRSKANVVSFFQEEV